MFLSQCTHAEWERKLSCAEQVPQRPALWRQYLSYRCPFYTYASEAIQFENNSWAAPRYSLIPFSTTYTTFVARPTSNIFPSIIRKKYSFPIINGILGILV